jgi:hypothetical protein
MYHTWLSIILTSEINNRNDTNYWSIQKATNKLLIAEDTQNRYKLILQPITYKERWGLSLVNDIR